MGQAAASKPLLMSTLGLGIRGEEIRKSRRIDRDEPAPCWYPVSPIPSSITRPAGACPGLSALAAALYPCAGHATPAGRNLATRPAAGRLQPLAACHHRVPFLKAFFPSASVPCGVAVAPPRNDRPHRGFFTVASHQRRPLMGPDRRRSQATRVRSESHICQVLSEIIVRRDEYTIIVYTTALPV